MKSISPGMANTSDSGSLRAAIAMFFISSTLPASTGFPNGAKFSTAVHEYAGGLRYRMPFGAGNYFFGSLTGGEHAFTFHSTSTDPTMQRGNLDIPDTIYRFLRPGGRSSGR